MAAGPSPPAPRTTGCTARSHRGRAVAHPGPAGARHRPAPGPAAPSMPRSPVMSGVSPSIHLAERPCTRLVPGPAGRSVDCHGPRRDRRHAADPGRRHLGEARVPQPVRLGQGADREVHDRARRARGPAPAGRHDRRGEQRQHRQRDEHGRRRQGLPDARRHAQRDEPGTGGDLPGVRRRGAHGRRLPRQRRARPRPRARRPARLLRAAAVRQRVERRREPRLAGPGDPAAAARRASCRTRSSAAWAPAGRWSASARRSAPSTRRAASWASSRTSRAR